MGIRGRGIGTRFKETQRLAKNTHAMLKGFDAEHGKMSAEQSKDLVGFAADLTMDVGSMLKRYRSEHQDMAASLKASLEKNTEDIETYVKNKLREFSAAHAEMSDDLKKDLAKYVADIVKGTQKLLAGFRGERESMGAHWQAMAATMARKRGISPAETEEGAAAKAIEKAGEKPKRGKKGGRRPAKRG